MQDELSEDYFLEERLPVGAHGGVDRDTLRMLGPDLIVIACELFEDELLYDQGKLAPRKFDSFCHLGGS